MMIPDKQETLDHLRVHSRCETFNTNFCNVPRSTDRLSRQGRLENCRDSNSRVPAIQGTYFMGWLRWFRVEIKYYLYQRRCFSNSANLNIHRLACHGSVECFVFARKYWPFPGVRETFVTWRKANCFGFSALIWYCTKLSNCFRC